MRKILLSASLLLINQFGFCQSWVAQNTGFGDASRGVDQIFIVDANTVWAKAYDGSGAAGAPQVQEFTRTVNGGATWTPGLIDIGYPTWSINNISPINGSTAWISAIDLASGATAPTPGGVWKTTDGGLTWSQQNPTAFIGSGAFINGVHFWDANEGIAFGDPIANNKIECYRTTDGGVNWTSVTTVPNMTSGEYNYNNGNVFVGNLILLPTNKGKVLRSADRGLTWTKLNSPLTDFGSAAVSGSMYFTDATTGVLLGTLDSGANYKLYNTTNGGITWSTPAGNYAGGFNRLLSYVPGTQTIVACGISATPPAIPGSSYSSNNGLSFTQIDTGNQRGIVKMLTGSVGWCGGFNAVSPSGVSTGGIFKLNGTLSNDDFKKLNTVVANPNPTNGLLDIKSSNDFDTITIVDLIGKIILTSTFGNVSEKQVDLSNLQTGTYLLTISSDQASKTIKILKQ